ncbi:hypothetical protein TCAL_15982, partial [Tigriopus californicus]
TLCFVGVVKADVDVDVDRGLVGHSTTNVTSHKIDMKWTIGISNVSRDQRPRDASCIARGASPPLNPFPKTTQAGEIVGAQILEVPQATVA